MNRSPHVKLNRSFHPVNLASPPWIRLACRLTGGMPIAETLTHFRRLRMDCTAWRHHINKRISNWIFSHPTPLR